MNEPQSLRSSPPPWRPNLEAVTGLGRCFALGWVSGTVTEARATQPAPQGAIHADEPPKSLRRSQSVREQVAILRDELVLADADGSEHLFQLDELQPIARRGDEVTVLWVAHEGTGRTTLVAVRNHSDGTTYYDDEALLGLFFRERSGVLWAALLICTCFTPLLFRVPWVLLRRRRARREIAYFKDRLEFMRG
jgi:hypothetical protein